MARNPKSVQERPTTRHLRAVPSHEEIARRAYELWQARGGGHGGHEEDWFRAEQELMRSER